MKRNKKEKHFLIFIFSTFFFNFVSIFSLKNNKKKEKKRCFLKEITRKKETKKREKNKNKKIFKYEAKDLKKKTVSNL